MLRVVVVLRISGINPQTNRGGGRLRFAEPAQMFPQRFHAYETVIFNVAIVAR